MISMLVDYSLIDSIIDSSFAYCIQRIPVCNLLKQLKRFQDSFGWNKNSFGSVFFSFVSVSFQFCFNFISTVRTVLRW